VGNLAKDIVGTWRLRSHLQVAIETGESIYPRGDDPPGLIIYTSDGWFSIIAVPAARKPPVRVLTEPDETLCLWRGLTAYAGRYSTKGDDAVIHHVEVSWNEIWGNTDQERKVKLDGDKLTIIAGPDTNPRDGKVCISTLEWDRVR
jgi:hypothetical protein